MNLREEIKNHAYQIGADLVGFGDVGRCKHAPIMMSPQGVFPGSKSIVVMALHHPDACIELGGEKHPQEIGPYSVQYLMNSRLDELSYRMATFIENKGYGAIPIASSNIWRYNSYKDLKAVFAPDISHIYMAVVAGLADMGYNGLALTPEFGARNRFVTVITDLELEPTPLIPPGTLCDGCMLCRKHCPSLALSTEIDGEKVLKIEDYEYRFANKNLWRCAWGEHFDLDLDLELPEKVTEEVIVDMVKKHGIRGGEMGQCLKFCLPRNRRVFDRNYSKTPIRRNAASMDESLESRAVTDKLVAECHGKDVEAVAVTNAETLRAAGIDIDKVLPGAQCAISLLRRVPAEIAANKGTRHHDIFVEGVDYHLDSVCYDLTRNLENLGFTSLMTIQRSASHPDPVDPVDANTHLHKHLLGDQHDQWRVNTVYTRKRFAEIPFRADVGAPEKVPAAYRHSADLTSVVKGYAAEVGADLVGVASAARISALADQLRPAFDGEKYFEASDHSTRFMRWEPEIVEKERKVLTAADYLPGAKSVLVIGLRIHERVLEFATKPPAEAVGPYSFESYVTRWQGGLMAGKIVQKLNRLGYKAVFANDLMGLGSALANPRGGIDDFYCNRFAALAAGLGGLTKSGRVFTPDFGIRQRFLAVVTDAELTADRVSTLVPELCDTCPDACITTCPTVALTKETVQFAIDGVPFSFSKIDRNRCDWSKRYAISGDEGFKYLGSPLDKLPEPGKPVDAAAMAEALKGHDPIKKYRPVVCEPCVINCPYSQPGC